MNTDTEQQKTNAAWSGFRMFEQDRADAARDDRTGPDCDHSCDCCHTARCWEVK